MLTSAPTADYPLPKICESVSYNPKNEIFKTPGAPESLPTSSPSPLSPFCLTGRITRTRIDCQQTLAHLLAVAPYLVDKGTCSSPCQFLANNTPMLSTSCSALTAAATIPLKSSRRKTHRLQRGANLVFDFLLEVSQLGDGGRDSRYLDAINPSRTSILLLL